ncbi:hypothetical protein ID866_7548 [Astraeus odoratus]|nr:hypothetical protein ID866_7548 [Astraeus odoratus]
MSNSIEDYMRMFSDHRIHSALEKHSEACATVTQVDTRRFGTVFPPDAPENESVDCGDDPGDEDDCTMSESHWEFHATVSPLVSQSQVGGSSEDSYPSTSSAAQQVIDQYRAAQLGRHRPHAPREKELPTFPDDQRSMVTLNSPEPTAELDLTWRPPPKVHVHSSTKEELEYAGAQAREMLRRAGLSFDDRIQCRRYGCKNILDNGEALKYHLHFHLIGDDLDRERVIPPNSSAQNASSQSTHRFARVAPTNTLSNPSKSFVEPRKNSDSKQSAIPIVSAPRKLSSGGGHRGRSSTSSDHKTVEVFSPRATPINMFNIAVLANATNSVRSQSPPSVVSPGPGAPHCGRRNRARARTISNNGGIKQPVYNTSIAALISPPTSPSPHHPSRTMVAAQKAFPFTLPVHDSGVFIHSEEPVFAKEGKAERAKSPSRAKSPLRAKSPIRDGLKRVLSIGCMYS